MKRTDEEESVLPDRKSPLRAKGTGRMGHPQVHLRCGVTMIEEHSQEWLCYRSAGAEDFGGGAFADFGAIGEASGVHLANHAEGAAIAFGLALGKMAEVRDFSADEEGGGGVGAGSDAGTATDAGGGVHGAVGVLLGDREIVGVLRGAGGDRNEAAGGDDAVKGRPIDSEVLDDGKGGGAPRLEVELVAVLEMAHVELADGGAG